MPEKESILESELKLTHGRSNPVSALFWRFASVSLDRLLSLHVIRENYRRIPPCKDAFEFAEKSLDVLQVRYELRDCDMNAVPESGPAIVTANHPFGGIDGLILLSLLSKKRKDIMVMANYVLGNVPELRPVFFLVDPFGTKGSERQNISALKKALNWVRKGGMLVTFPAGEVSHLTLKNRKIEDKSWNHVIGRMIHMTRAPVLPVYFHGSNSSAFQLAGLVHSKLRTAMLPMELLKKKQSTIRLKIGNLIPANRIQQMTDLERLMSYLRFRTYLLATSFEYREEADRVENDIHMPDFKRSPVIPAVGPDILAEEVSRIPGEQKLAQMGSQCVYYGTAQQIPWLLREIGRLREITFREAGEGTGRAIDMDHFDQTYVHLVLWNKKNNEVIGAYRLGQTDKILPEHGKMGLYTHTLFQYKDALLEKMSPALEMGRTFVRREYQKSFSSLLLLWRGIGAYVAQNPRYKILFGAVSITNDYHSYSRDLMVTFLKMNHFMPHLSGLVKARRPYKVSLKRFKRKTIHAETGNMEEVSSWISGIERDGKGLPILLKQYLKLGGKILCFNVDLDFGNALDSLIMVDLTQTDAKTLKRYMGDDGLGHFYDYHFKGTDHSGDVKKALAQAN